MRRSEMVLTNLHGCGGQNPYHFGIGEFTTHFRTYFSGDWDVYWGYDLDFDPWPHVCNQTNLQHIAAHRRFCNAVIVVEMQTQHVVPNKPFQALPSCAQAEARRFATLT